MVTQGQGQEESWQKGSVRLSSRLSLVLQGPARLSSRLPLFCRIVIEYLQNCKIKTLIIG